MGAGEILQPTGEASPRLKARIAGAFYLVTFVTAVVTLVAHGSLWFAANLIADASYVVVTVLLYVLFKPVSPSLSLLAALFSLAGCAVGVLNLFHLAHIHVSTLVFFGFYCLLIGYLLLRSTFLPRILGVLMMFAGLGWLTFLSPPFAKSLSPYNMIPGMLGEGVLTVWLLVVGVNAQRWREQASAESQ